MLLIRLLAIVALFVLLVGGCTERREREVRRAAALRQKAPEGVRPRGRVPMPTVPDWLAADPPALAVMMTDGSYMTMQVETDWDQPGSGPEGEPQTRRRWLHYDAEGELIHELAPGEEWWEYYWPEFRQVARDFADQGATFTENNGYVFFRDSEKNMLAVYDFDGTLMPEDFDPLTSAPRFRPLTAEELVKLNRQQKQR